MGGRSRRWMVQLPPGAASHVREGTVEIMVPLWLYWVQVSLENARQSRRMRSSDAHLDSMSAALAGERAGFPDDGSGSNANQELLAAMVAVSSAAHAIDAFYGAIKPIVEPPRSRAKRSHQILEGLKLGFRIGNYAQAWLGELDWLFNHRDDLVHHSEQLRPAVVSRTTEHTDVFSAPEALDLSANSGTRQSF